VARTLQRSLLVGELPAAEGLDIGVSYTPAEAGLEVGGDWYDAFWTGGGRRCVSLVVGDVVGRGLGAATTMGQLRSAVRALAQADRGPARLLTALDAYARRHRIGQMTTLVYGELDLDARSFAFACAGHPPPLVLGPERTASLLWQARSAPLDAELVPDERRGQAEVELEPGATVLLHTDGLIERRRSTLDAGLSALESLAGSLAGQPAATVVDTMDRTLADPRDPDDVCLLAARIA
jgi:serine phosphatase RsbU (regulator of sigma subunit)